MRVWVDRRQKNCRFVFSRGFELDSSRTRLVRTTADESVCAFVRRSFVRRRFPNEKGFPTQAQTGSRLRTRRLFKGNSGPSEIVCIWTETIDFIPTFPTDWQTFAECLHKLIGKFDWQSLRSQLLISHPRCYLDQVWLSPAGLQEALDTWLCVCVCCPNIVVHHFFFVSGCFGWTWKNPENTLSYMIWLSSLEFDWQKKHQTSDTCFPSVCNAHCACKSAMIFKRLCVGGQSWVSVVCVSFFFRWTSEWAASQGKRAKMWIRRVVKTNDNQN